MPLEVYRLSITELKKLRRQLLFLYVDSEGKKRITIGEKFDLISMELDHRLRITKYKAL
tara:strand:- start:1078 stop:1254 length:177 start_codon:yes stop_codon:yes gene_type:complete